MQFCMKTETFFSFKNSFREHFVSHNASQRMHWHQIKRFNFNKILRDKTENLLKLSTIFSREDFSTIFFREDFTSIFFREDFSTIFFLEDFSTIFFREYFSTIFFSEDFSAIFSQEDFSTIFNREDLFKDRAIRPMMEIPSKHDTCIYLFLNASLHNVSYKDNAMILWMLVNFVFARHIRQFASVCNVIQFPCSFGG